MSVASNHGRKTAGRRLWSQSAARQVAVERRTTGLLSNRLPRQVFKSRRTSLSFVKLPTRKNIY